MPFGNGLIHDTFRVAFAVSGREQHAILPRIRTAIFQTPAALMETIERVRLGQHATPPEYRTGRKIWPARGADCIIFWYSPEQWSKLSSQTPVNVHAV